MKKYLLSLTFLLGTILVFSQRVPPPPATPQSGGPGAPDNPIDGLYHLSSYCSCDNLLYI
jgi:hypothetical protein